jgi:hypothetical protein
VGCGSGGDVGAIAGGRGGDAKTVPLLLPLLLLLVVVVVVGVAAAMTG